MENPNCVGVSNEIFKIKRAYCIKCANFDKDKKECTKNKIYNKCFKNHERERNHVC